MVGLHDMSGHARAATAGYRGYATASRSPPHDAPRPHAANRVPHCVLQARTRLTGHRRQRGKLVRHHAHIPPLGASCHAEWSESPAVSSLPAPGKKGQSGSCTGNSTAGGRRRANSSGRLARSEAMMIHSLVAKFWRNSGIAVAYRLPQRPVRRWLARDMGVEIGDRGEGGSESILFSLSCTLTPNPSP